MTDAKEKLSRVAPSRLYAPCGLFMKLAALLVVGTIAGCATPKLVRVDPVPGDQQEVVYRNGTPVIVSRAATSAVSLTPVAGPTGRYELDNRVAFIIAVENRGPERIDISERSVAATANGKPLRQVSPYEVEETILSNAAYARAAAAVAGTLRAMSAARAGTTTFSGTTGGKPFSGHSFNEGAATEAQRQIARDTAASVAAIDVGEHAARQGVAGMLQRNTLQPGAIVSGAVVMELPRLVVCPTKVDDSENVVAWSGSRRPAGERLCQIVASVDVDGEVHRFTLDEALGER